MVAVAAGDNDPLKIAMLQQVSKARHNCPLAFNQLLRWAQLLHLNLLRVEPVVDQVTAKPYHHLGDGRA